ncbi:MAG: hypothetical protein ACE5HV_13360 [Acidobacteriota bacterium]
MFEESRSHPHRSCSPRPSPVGLHRSWSTGRTLRTLSLAFALAFAVMPAMAHGPAVKVEKEEVAAGATLKVSGEGIGKNEEITLRLVGLLGSHELAKVHGDEHGRFALTVTIPETLAPGTYEVEARAGKINAKATLRILAVAADEHDHEPVTAEEAGASIGDEEDEEEAHAEPMPLQHQWSLLENSFAAGISLLLLGIGAFCMRRSRRIAP